MKNRLHFIPVAVIILTLFIIGSIYDLNISKSIANIGNTFTKFFAALATLPISALYSFESGNLIKMVFNRYKNNKMYQRILLIAFAVILFVGGTLLFGFNIGGQHSFNFGKPLGLLAGLALTIPLAVLGYFINNKIDSPNLLKIMIFTSLVVAFTSGCIEVIKLLVPRIRFIAVKGMGEQYFRPWYDPSITKEMIEQVKAWGNGRELYKSFPSGHSNFAFGCSFILMMLPIIFNNEKLMKYQHLFFYGGFIYYVLIAFSRIYGGAHYLSDTTFSGLFAIMVFFIANEIYLRKIAVTFKKEKE